MNVILTHVRIVPHVMTKLMDTHVSVLRGYTGTDCETGNYVSSALDIIINKLILILQYCPLMQL